MTLSDSTPLGREWTTLQNNIEQYERNCLAVKLVAVALYVAALLFTLDESATLALIVVLWIQEAVLRTFQSRLSDRIVQVESQIRTGDGIPMQLHTQWLAARQGMAGMLLEYARAAARPTVAFPYVALLLIDVALYASGAGDTASAVRG